MADPLITAAGGAAGAGATLLVREKIDPTKGTVVPQLKQFGTPSALLGVFGGGLSLVLGLLGEYDKIEIPEELKDFLLGFGAGAFTVGIVARIRLR